MRPLPFYTVRTSTRARRVRLTVTAREGLVVTVPSGWRGDADEVVRTKQAWAERVLASVAERRALFLGGAEALLPDVIELRVVGEAWPVHYRQTTASGVRVVAEGGVLEVRGHVDDAAACLAAASRWLDRTSRDLLLPLLAEMAEHAGVVYASARVRRQRTLWGRVRRARRSHSIAPSCSCRNTW